MVNVEFENNCDFTKINEFQNNLETPTESISNQHQSQKRTFIEDDETINNINKRIKSTENAVKELSGTIDSIHKILINQSTKSIEHNSLIAQTQPKQQALPEETYSNIAKEQPFVNYYSSSLTKDNIANGYNQSKFKSALKNINDNNKILNHSRMIQADREPYAQFPHNLRYIYGKQLTKRIVDKLFPKAI